MSCSCERLIFMYCHNDENEKGDRLSERGLLLVELKYFFLEIVLVF